MFRKIVSSVYRRGECVARDAGRIHTHLLATAAFNFPFKTGIGVDAPVHGQCQQLAMAFCVLHIGIQIFIGCVHSVTKGIVFAISSAQIQCDRTVVAVAVVQCETSHTAFNRVGRTLHHVVGNATRRAGASLYAAGAFEEFNAFFVVHANHGFRIDGQAFAAVVVAVVQHKATHTQHVPIGGRVVTVGHRRI